jgi:LuxR family transcriptional regulator, maltose regulon positive regulatory protein
VPDSQLTAEAWIPRTKLVMPRPGPGVVFDPVLLDHLRTTTTPLTLITAQAGSGKTTLAATLAHDVLPATPAWISLDAGDDDLAVVLHLLSMALDPVLPGGCPSLRDLLRAGLPAAADPRQAVGVLLNDVLVAEPDPVLLVLDDLHVITDPAASTALGYLLDHAPEGLRVLATSRTEPRLGIPRRRTHGQLTEVGVDDLRMTPDRAAALLNDRLGLGLSPAQVEEAVATSGGWVVGVRLLGEALARGADSPRTSVGPAALYDFLTEEIFASTPEHVQQFLLDTSVLDELDVPTCKTVSGRDDASALLAGLHRTLSFLVLAGGAGPDTDGGYRYHDLFRGFLRRRLEEDPQRAVELHRRAADAATEPASRIEHLIAASQHDVAAVEIERLAQSTPPASPFTRRLAGWVARLDAPLRSRPWLRTVTGVAALGRGDLADATTALEAALDAFPPEDRLGPWVVTRHLHKATQDHARFAPLLGRLERDPAFVTLPPVTRLDHHLGRAYAALHTGDWDEASRRLTTAVELATTSGSLATAEVLAQHLSPLLVACNGGVGLTASYLAWTRSRFPDPTPLLKLGIEHQAATVSYLRGRLDEAVAAVERAADLPERLGGLPYHRAALTWVAAGAAYASGRPAVAASVLDDAATPGTELDRALRTQRLAMRARIARLRNDRTALEQMERELTVPLPSGYAERLQLTALSVQAQAAWTARELTRAADVLRSGLELEERLRLVPGVASLRLDLAMVLADAGRETEAVRELGVVLATAERRGWVGTVVEAGPEVVPLLEAAVRRGAGGTVAGAALEVLRGSPQHAVTAVPGTDEALSAREMEVLALLAEGASNADLAARLFVSVNTAKTHVGRILTKLDARSRTEAVARARALHLL